jgi:hypothetical protein
MIKDLILKISQVNALDLLGILGTEFFSSPEKWSIEKSFGQAHFEYIAGLVSSLPYSESAEMPSRDEVEEIKSIALKILQSYFLDFFPSSPGEAKLITDEDIVKNQKSLYALSEYLILRSEGYPEQLWKAAVDQYAAHNDFLRAKFGFSIEEAVNIFRWLIQKIEERANVHFSDFVSIMKKPMDTYQKLKNGQINEPQLLSIVKEIRSSDIYQKLKSHNKKTKDIFLFRLSELENAFGPELTRNFIKRFGARFGEINRQYREPKDLNDLNKKPILVVGCEHIFIPVPQLLIQVPVKTIYYDLIQDPDYHVVYEKSRGEYLEERAFDLFGGIFHPANIHRKLRYGPDEKDEVDLLIEFDTKILIVECKSKPLTLPARQGTLNEIHDDFTKAIQRAYDQAKRAKDYITQNKTAEFWTVNEKRIVVKSEEASEIFLICVTAELFSAFATDLSTILKKEPDESCPWAICLRDLEIVAQCFTDPYLFLHFLKRRQVLHGRVLSFDELDYVGNYLVNGLFFEEEFKKGTVMIALIGFTEQFDKDYLTKIGKLKTAQVGTSWSNPAFENLIGSIKSIGTKRHSNIILTLLDIDSKARDDLINLIKSTIRNTRRDGRLHDFTMLFENFGISFVSSIRRDGLKEKVIFDATLKKYKHKCSKWLCMGRDVTDDQYLVNEFVYLEFKWQYDPKLEQATKHLKGKRFSIDEKT